MLSSFDVRMLSESREHHSGLACCLSVQLQPQSFKIQKPSSMLVVPFCKETSLPQGPVHVLCCGRMLQVVSQVTKESPSSGPSWESLFDPHCACDIICANKVSVWKLGNFTGNSGSPGLFKPEETPCNHVCEKPVHALPKLGQLVAGKALLVQRETHQNSTEEGRTWIFNMSGSSRYAPQQSAAHRAWNWTFPNHPALIDAAMGVLPQGLMLLD